jgi:hypothetical protein
MLVRALMMPYTTAPMGRRVQLARTSRWYLQGFRIHHSHYWLLTVARGSSLNIHHSPFGIHAIHDTVFVRQPMGIAAS